MNETKLPLTAVFGADGQLARWEVQPNEMQTILHRGIAPSASATADNVCADDLPALARAVALLIHERGQWIDSATQLLSEINRRATAHARSRSDWPSTPEHLGVLLRAQHGALERAGIESEFVRKDGSRKIVLKAHS